MKWLRKLEPKTYWVTDPNHMPSMGGTHDSTMYWGNGTTEPVLGKGWFTCSCGVAHGSETNPVTGWNDAMVGHLESVSVIQYRP